MLLGSFTYLTEFHSMVVDLLRSTSSCFSGEVMERADVISRLSS